jgi:glycerol-3-phosphate acyltransferase PlsY
VATGSGVLVVLFPLLAVVCVAAWWLLGKLTGKAALASIIAVALVPVGLVVTGAEGWEYVAVALLCALIVVKHGGNVVRMLRREEHTLSKH